MPHLLLGSNPAAGQRAGWAGEDRTPSMTAKDPAPAGRLFAHPGACSIFGPWRTWRSCGRMLLTQTGLGRMCGMSTAAASPAFAGPPVLQARPDNVGTAAGT